jgi:hypothetical protein
MSETITYTTEKKAGVKKHHIQFKINDEYEKKLTQIFQALKIDANQKPTDKMLQLIDRVIELINQPAKVVQQLERIDIDRNDKATAVVSTTTTLPPHIEPKPTKPIGKPVEPEKIFQEPKAFQELGDQLPYHREVNTRYNPNETTLKASPTHAKASEIKHSHTCLRGLKLNDPDTAERACQYCFEHENHYYMLCKATEKFPVQKTLF